MSICFVYECNDLMNECFITFNAVGKFLVMRKGLLSINKDILYHCECHNILKSLANITAQI